MAHSPKGLDIIHRLIIAPLVLICDCLLGPNEPYMFFFSICDLAHYQRELPTVHAPIESEYGTFVYDLWLRTINRFETYEMSARLGQQNSA